MLSVILSRPFTRRYSDYEQPPVKSIVQRHDGLARVLVGCVDHNVCVRDPCGSHGDNNDKNWRVATWNESQWPNKGRSGLPQMRDCSSTDPAKLNGLNH